MMICFFIGFESMGEGKHYCFNCILDIGFSLILKYLKITKLFEFKITVTKIFVLPVLIIYLDIKAWEIRT